MTECQNLNVDLIQRKPFDERATSVDASNLCN